MRIKGRERGGREQGVGSGRCGAGSAPDPRVAGKIAFFMRALDGGGAQRDMILLANEIAARGRSVDLLSLVPTGALRALVASRVKVVPIAGSRLRSAVPALRRALLTCRPQVLVSAEAAPNLVAIAATRLLARSARPRLVLREVGSPSFTERLDPHRQTRIAYRLLHAAYRWADVIVTLTEGASRDLARNFGVPAHKLARAPSNAVVEDAALAPTETEARQQGLVVSVGRLSAEKDHATLLRAFAKLDRRTGARLEIVGTGPLRQALATLIEDLALGDRVSLTGFVLDPFPVFRRAALAVSSSRCEGFGNAIIEALSCGTPVVATDCPYGPREILDGGRYGHLVPVGDADALARAMGRALTSPPERAVLRARAAEHTIARGADALMTIIDRCVEREACP